MAETIIFAETQYTGFAYSQDYGAYMYGINPAPFTIAAGENYIVRWDNIDYPCTATAVPNGSLGMGNLSLAGMEGGNPDAPFIIGWSEVGVSLYSNEDKNSHTVGIYRIVEDEPETPDEPAEPEQPEGIVLKDRNGKDVAYYGIETVTFDTTTEGKQQVYTKGVAVEGLEIVPDFSAGDMPVVAADNTLVKSATIKKPDTLTPDNVRNGVEVSGVSGTFIGDTEAVEVALSMADGDQVISPSAAGKVLSGVTVKKPETLIPENIAEGVNIAGIIGSLAAGKIAYGTVKSSGSAITVEHGLGCVPDAIFIFRSSNMSGDTSKVHGAYGLSQAFAAKIGAGAILLGFLRGSSGNPAMNVYSGYIDTVTSTSANTIWGATDEVFCTPSKLDTTNTYIWYAIGGLV